MLPSVIQPNIQKTDFMFGLKSLSGKRIQKHFIPGQIHLDLKNEQLLVLSIIKNTVYGVPYRGPISSKAEDCVHYGSLLNIFSNHLTPISLV